MMVRKIISVPMVCVFFLVSAALFLLHALVTFDPYAHSWFFYVTESVETVSFFKQSTANIASLFFYLFGSASLLCVFFLLFSAYIILYEKKIGTEWERLCAYPILLSCVATLFAAFGVDFLYSPYPGGTVGRSMYSFLSVMCGHHITVLFVLSMIFSSFIIIARFSFMPFIHYAGVALLYIGTIVHKYRCVNKIISSVYYVVVYPCILFVQFLQTLYSGSALKYTDLVTPGDEHAYADELIAFAKQLQAEKLLLHTFVPNEFISNEASIDTVSLVDMHSTKKEDTDFYTRDKNNLEQSVENTDDASTYEKRYIVPNVNIFIGFVDDKHDAHLQEQLEARAVLLEEKLKRFGVSGTVVAIKRGPVVTLFEYKPHIDTKLSKILTLEDDLALALQALSIRIIAPIPGRAVVGFEVANTHRKDVLLSSVIQSDSFKNFSGDLPFILGQDTVGNTVIVDLARMPHVLIAGSTGSGKSVALNTLLMSLLCTLSPDELKLILIDPKRLEFALYENIPHLLFPIVTQPKRSVPILRWVVMHMEQRYEQIAQRGVRNIADYNDAIKKEGQEPLPYIVVIIDELSDLMLLVGREVEDSITRITQMARAAGIHMVLATQRPSVDVITGLIKVNFPSRISFRVTSRVDSRTILDAIGAEKLLGKGDMLFLDATESTLRRVHGAYVSDAEIKNITNHIRSERAPEYLDISQELLTSNRDTDTDVDELYNVILEFLQEIDEVSISLLQRKFRIGYNRSARIIDMLEMHGLIMPSDGGKARKIVR